MKKYSLTAIVMFLIFATLQLYAGNSNDGEPASVIVLPKKNTSFYFVQITDTHFGYQGQAEVTSKVVKHINNLPMKIEFVAITGDIVADSIENPKDVEDALKTFGRLKVPVHYLPGNHDILPRKRLKTTRIFKDEFGKLIHSQTYKGVTFIFAYTEPLATNSGAVKKTFYGVRKELDVADGRPIVVFHHTPSVEDFYSNELHNIWKKDIRQRWNKLINSYNVKAIIAGHFHRDEHHWIGKVPLYVSASVDTGWGRQPTFGIYEYNNGRIGYRTQYITP